MTEHEAIAYIENYTWSTTRLGLERTRELLKALGNPQKSLKFIHVTGSNGKGSTCAMLAEILRRAGFHTGLYTSPYIENFCERIQIDEKNISGRDLSGITERVRAIADAMEDHPSQFELITAIAMEYFCRQRCDIVVLEVGMGGALDSTNVIDPPEVAVITNIGLEHTEYLGDTLEKIAQTKAGIVKSGCACVCYDGAPEVTRVIKSVCQEKSVPLTCADFSKLHSVSQTLKGQTFTYAGKSYHLALLGMHQLYNAATVLETVEALRSRNWHISDAVVTDSFMHVCWPARLEVINSSPLFLLDGGHNPQCAQALVSSIGSLIQNQKVIYLLGVLADKDYVSVLETLIPSAREFVCLTPLSDRALEAHSLAHQIEAMGAKATARDTIDAGIQTALSMAGESGSVVCFGSLYLVGAVRSAFHAANRGSFVQPYEAAQPKL